MTFPGQRPQSGGWSGEDHRSPGLLSTGVARDDADGLSHNANDHPFQLRPVVGWVTRAPGRSQCLVRPVLSLARIVLQVHRNRPLTVRNFEFVAHTPDHLDVACPPCHSGRQPTGVLDNHTDAPRPALPQVKDGNGPCEFGGVDACICSGCRPITRRPGFGVRDGQTPDVTILMTVSDRSNYPSSGNSFSNS